MNCSKAEKLMMKYMDGDITEDESQVLNSHLLACANCKMAFQLYDTILLEAESTPKITAPEDFVPAVMAKIAALPQEERANVYSRRDLLKLGLAGAFTTLFSLSTLLIYFRDSIISNYISHPYWGAVFQRLQIVSDRIEDQTQVLALSVNGIVQNVERILSSGAGLFSLAIIALCAAQAIIIRRKNR